MYFKKTLKIKLNVTSSQRRSMGVVETQSFGKVPVMEARSFGSCLMFHTVAVFLWRPELNRKLLFMSHYPPLTPSIVAPLTQGFSLRGKK